MRAICLGSTLTETACLPAPYTTAGTLPLLRTRRATFLLPAWRTCASTTFVSVAVAIIALSSAGVASHTEFLYEQLADRSLLVNGADRGRDQPRHRKHLDLGFAARRFAQRDGIGHHHLLQLRLRDSLDRRSRQHRVRGAGHYLLCSAFQQRVRGLHQRARGVDDVVEDQAGAAFDVADHVH